MTTEFVGRRVELDRLAPVLEATRGGQLQLVVLQGEAGIGKTRLLEEVVFYAAGRGFRTLVGRADDFDKRVPFAALRLALGPALRDDDGAAVDDARALDAALHLAAIPGQAPEAPEVFELLYRVLSRWTARGPVLLAIDDVHSADADTVAALGFLARHVRDRLLLVVAARAHTPDLTVEVATAIVHLRAVTDGLLIEVGPFDAGDTATLVASQLGGTPTQATVDRVLGSTGGNPFFTVELLRALADSGMIHDAGGGGLDVAADAPLAVTAGTTILHRVFRLGPVVRDVASAAAILPQLSLDDLPWLAAASGVDEDAVGGAFDALVEANVLQTVGDGYRFTHPIVRNTIYEDLGPARRRRLHSTYAEMLLQRRALGGDIDIVDVARHLRFATPSSHEAAAAIFIEAGDTSLGQAPRSAAAWYGDALRLMNSASGQRGMVLARLARANYLASNNEAAATAAREALVLLPPGPLRARSAHLCFAALQTCGRVDEALELFDQLASEPGVVTPRMIAQRAQLLLWLSRIGEAETELDRAGVLAGPQGHHFVDTVRLHLLWTAGRPAEARRLADRMTAKLETYPPVVRAGTLIALSSSFVYNGEPLAAEAAFEALGDGPIRTATVATQLVWLHYSLGRWDEALELASRTEVELENGGDRTVLPLLLRAVAHMRAERGELQGIAALRERLLGGQVFRPNSLAAVGRLDLAAGDLDSARAMLRRACDLELRSGRIGTSAWTLYWLAEVEVLAGRAPAAAAVCDSLAEVARDGSGARSQALQHLTLAMVRSDVEEAQLALMAAESGGLAFERARALQLCGSLRADAELLVAAAEAYRSLGITARQRDVSQALRQLGRRMPRRVTAPGQLSAMEHELARLVGEGMTNRQIASVVHLSPKTIEVYLSRLYVKVGCASRVDLAVAVSSGRLNG